MLLQLSDMFSKQNFPSISDIPFAHALKSKKDLPMIGTDFFELWSAVSILNMSYNLNKKTCCKKKHSSQKWLQNSDQNDYQ